jgi:hypothetical protein
MRKVDFAPSVLRRERDDERPEHFGGGFRTANQRISTVEVNKI